MKTSILLASLGSMIFFLPPPPEMIACLRHYMVASSAIRNSVHVVWTVVIGSVQIAVPAMFHFPAIYTMPKVHCIHHLSHGVQSSYTDQKVSPLVAPAANRQHILVSSRAVSMVGVRPAEVGMACRRQLASTVLILVLVR